MKRPVLLLKTKSTPHDGYDEFFSANGYTPFFIPVLSHNFHNGNLTSIKELFESGSLDPGPNRKYGGLIFTSQRAVEAFASILGEIENSKTAKASTSLILYTVGPATARSLTALRDNHLPNASIHGAEMGNGENLALYILEHYNSFYLPSLESRSQSPQDTETDGERKGNGSGTGRKPPLLFLVGETRRDIIPKTLMDNSLPEARRIGVEEVVVYETGVVEGFEGDFETSLSRLQSSDAAAEVWVVVFSPTGCDAMVRVLRREEDEKAAEGGASRRVFVATIGPTTRDHLVKECRFEPEVCAGRPSPEGVGGGIEEFMRGLRNQG